MAESYGLLAVIGSDIKTLWNIDDKNHICLTASRQKREITAGIYCTDGDKTYDNLLSNKTQIETLLSGTVEWRGDRKHKRILVSKHCDIDDKSNWANAFNWLYEMSIKIYQIVKSNS